MWFFKICKSVKNSDMNPYVPIAQLQRLSTLGQFCFIDGWLGSSFWSWGPPTGCSSSWCFLEEGRGICRTGRLGAKPLPSWKSTNCHQLESPLPGSLFFRFLSTTQEAGGGASLLKGWQDLAGGMQRLLFLRAFTVWFYFSSSEWEERRLCEDSCPLRGLPRQAWCKAGTGGKRACGLFKEI